MLGVLLAGALVQGCSTNSDEPGLDETIKDSVELTPVHASAKDGEIVSFTAHNARGEEQVFEYLVDGDRLVPQGDAPDLDDLDPATMGVIPAFFNGGAADTAMPQRDVDPADLNVQPWNPQQIEAKIPAITIDRSFRVSTDSFVQQLNVAGRNVEMMRVQDTGPSNAAELTRMQIDGIAQAEIYQFDDIQALDMWYRVAYQLHQAAGQDPTERIQINGMTMLRVGDHVDSEVVQAFANSPRLQLR
jgi:hypothetical protein